MASALVLMVPGRGEEVAEAARARASAGRSRGAAEGATSASARAQASRTDSPVVLHRWAWWSSRSTVAVTRVLGMSSSNPDGCRLLESHLGTTASGCGAGRRGMAMAPEAMTSSIRSSTLVQTTDPRLAAWEWPLRDEGLRQSLVWRRGHPMINSTRRVQLACIYAFNFRSARRSAGRRSPAPGRRRPPSANAPGTSSPSGRGASGSSDKPDAGSAGNPRWLGALRRSRS